MQRDMKIGMAVGVALVGIVGALFFRREPEPKDKESPPALQNADELDRRIGEKARGPYINGLEESTEPVAPVPAPQTASTQPKHKTENYEIPGFLTKDDATKNRELLSRHGAAAPDPIGAGDESLAADAPPAHNRDWEPAGTAGKKAAGAPQGTPAASAGSVGRTHVIQPGETLSGLASRFLGSSARYREIYDANRNVLKSPDDLPDGVTIVIPDDKPRDSQRGSGSLGNAAGNAGSRTTKPPKSSPQTSDADKPPAAQSRDDAPREKIRFVPVNRGPFSAGRAQPSSQTKSEAAPE